MFSECKEGSNEKNFAKPSKTLGANSIRHNPYMARNPPKIFRWRGIWEYHSMNIQSTKRLLMKSNFMIPQAADRNKQLNICNYSKFHSWSFQNRHGGNVSLPLSISQYSFGKIYLPDPGVMFMKHWAMLLLFKWLQAGVDHMKEISTNLFQF